MIVNHSCAMHTLKKYQLTDPLKCCSTVKSLPAGSPPAKVTNMPPAHCTVTTQAGRAVLYDKSKEHHILQSITHSMVPERVSVRQRVF